MSGFELGLGICLRVQVGFDFIGFRLFPPLGFGYPTSSLLIKRKFRKILQEQGGGFILQVHFRLLFYQVKIFLVHILIIFNTRCDLLFILRFLFLITMNSINMSFEALWLCKIFVTRLTMVIFLAFMYSSDMDFH